MGNRHNLDIEELFQDNTMSLLRELLEDFEVIATEQYMALIPNYEFKGFRDNIRAAVIAASLRLRSLDYAKRQYCDNKQDAQETEFTKYIDSYKAAKTHINYERHQEFLTVCKGRNMVLLSHQNFSRYADVILNLADFFSIVWELSQLDYMIKLESIEVKNGCPAVIQDRPFRKVIESHMNSFRKGC